MFNHSTRRPVLFFDANDGAGGNPDQDTDKTDGKKDDDDKQKQQDDLDRKFAERAERATKAERKKFLDALGLQNEKEFEDYLKAKKEADDKNKSEAQRLADDAKKAKEEVDHVTSESNEKIAAMQKRVEDTEIKVAAIAEVKDKTGKVVRPAFRAEAIDDVLMVIDRSKIEEKDGKLTGIAEALAELAKTKPYYLVEQTTSQTKGSPASRRSVATRGAGASSSEDKPQRLVNGL